MKASHLAILTLVLGLAIGFAIGGVLNSSNSAAAAPRTLGLDPSAPDVGKAASLASDAAIERVGELPSTGGALTSMASRSSSAPGPGARSSARKAISLAGAGQGDDDESAWTHTIHGAVLDADGDPMPGVQVVCLNRKPDGWRGLMKGKATAKLGRAWEGLPDVESELAKQAETLMNDRLHASTTVSDAMGRFTLENLREGIQPVRAYLDGYEFAPQAVHTGRECTLIGERVVELELDIRLPDGTQPASAVIFPGATTFGSELAWSPEEPRLRLKEAAFELVVRSGNVQRVDWRSQTSDYESEPRLMNVDTEGPGPHVVELRANQILRVQIDDASELVPKLPIWVKATPATGDLSSVRWSNPSHTALAIAPSGDFEVTGIPGGKYLIAAGRGEGNGAEVTQPVTIGEGVTGVRLELGEADLSEFVVVRCTRADGTPIDKVEFEPESEVGRLVMPGQLKPQRRARGEYWLSRGQLFQDADGGTLEKIMLTATTEVDGGAWVTVGSDDEEVTIEFEPACSLEVQVGGDLAAGYSVQVMQLGEKGKTIRPNYLAMTRATQKVKEDGRAVLNALQPGPYEVHLLQTGHEADGGGILGRSKRVTSEKVEVTRLGQPLELIVPTRHTVMVHAEGLEAGKTLRLSPAKGGGYRDRVTAKVGQDSMARFENVFAGEYTLRLEGGTDSMTITVPTGQVQFVTKVIYALRVRSVEERGPAALAGFQIDDLITEIGGKSVSGWSDVFELTNSAAGTSVPVTVLRGKQSTGLLIGPVGEKDGKPNSIGMALTTATK